MDLVLKEVTKSFVNNTEDVWQENFIFNQDGMCFGTTPAGLIFLGQLSEDKQRLKIVLIKQTDYAKFEGFWEAENPLDLPINYVVDIPEGYQFAYEFAVNQKKDWQNRRCNIEYISNLGKVIRD